MRGRARARRRLPGRQPRHGGHRRDRARRVLVRRPHRGRVDDGGARRRTSCGGWASCEPKGERARRRALPRQHPRPGLGVRDRRPHGRDLPRAPELGARAWSATATCRSPTATPTTRSWAAWPPADTRLETAPGPFLLNPGLGRPAPRRRPPGGLPDRRARDRHGRLAPGGLRRARRPAGDPRRRACRCGSAPGWPRGARPGLQGGAAVAWRPRPTWYPSRMSSATTVSRAL